MLRRVPVSTLPGDFLRLLLRLQDRQDTFDVVFLSSVNCEEFLSRDESQIPVDEVFFYRWVKANGSSALVCSGGFTLTLCL